MFNLELKNNEQGNNGADTCTFLKQPPIANKKTVLTDVQNDNRVLQNSRESSFSLDGGPTAEKVKVSGMKRLIPGFPRNHPWPPLPNHTATKEHLVYTTKKSEFVPRNEKTENRDRNISSPLKRFCSMQHEIPQKQTQVVEGNTHHVPMAISEYMVPKNMLSYSNPSLDSLTTSLANPGNGAEPAKTICLNVTTNVTLPSDSERLVDQNIGQKWEERYINLQNYLKICDNESTHKNHIQNLRHLSPAELSMYAVELEKRAIQLTIEEGKEFHRMKVLKILEKSAASVNASQKSEPSPSKK